MCRGLAAAGAYTTVPIGGRPQRATHKELALCELREEGDTAAPRAEDVLGEGYIVTRGMGEYLDAADIPQGHHQMTVPKCIAAGGPTQHEPMQAFRVDFDILRI